MSKAILLPLTALVVACVSPDGPFTAVGKPAMPLHEARPHCKQKARSDSGDGTTTTNWHVYEACMADLGWVKQAPPSAGGPGPTGGRGPSY